MAVIPPVITAVETLQGHVHQVLWGPAAAGDTFTAYPNAGAADRSVHVYGTFSSTVITVLGSNETASPPANLVALHDSAGTAISLTAASIVQVSEVTQWIAPAFTGGTGSDLYVALIVRRNL